MKTRVVRVYLLKLLIITFVVGLAYVVGSEVDVYYVPTGSMIPAIMPGDLVFARQVSDPSTIEVGSIVVARYNVVSISGERYDLIIHRVIDIDRSKGLVYLKGDNSPEIQVVPADNIVSVVVFGIPYIGYISLYLREYLVYIIALLIIYIIWSYR
ncbi:MAG: signal peptidase I [Desulfurococcales archaeon]|nr:signal peptidase I [Desulfurococcales archaeon]